VSKSKSRKRTIVIGLLKTNKVARSCKSPR